MRWHWAVAIFGVGCFQPVDSVDAGVDAGTTASDAGRTNQPFDAGPEEVDPCVWDGRGDGLCFAETAWVFDGTSCRSVCGAIAEVGRAGVFATSRECQATCPCAPEKFIVAPRGQAGPFELGGFCDEIHSAADEGAAPPWTGLSCDSNGLPGAGYPEVCLLDGVDHNRLDRRALSRACRASVQPQVKQVVCIVWID